MGPLKGWESKKIGAGPIPIETDEGWLCFYHGVLESCNGFVYSFSACILDKEQPWKVKYRCGEYLINPREIYECVGDVQNVTFPCATLCDAETGRIAIYYGYKRAELRFCSFLLVYKKSTGDLRSPLHINSVFTQIVGANSVRPFL